MSQPFSELRNGLPVWKLQSDDPAAAEGAKLELKHHAFEFPQGGVLALLLKVYDKPGRPQIFHHAIAYGSIEFLALERCKRMLLVFEKKGYISDTAIPLDLHFGDLPALGHGQEGLAPYVEAYRSHLNSAGSPEAAWDAIERSLQVPVKAGMSFGVKLVIIAVLAAVATGLGYYFGVI